MPSQPPLPPPPPPPRHGSSGGDDASPPPPPKLKSTATTKSSSPHARAASTASILKPSLVRGATGNSVTFADHKASQSDTGGALTLERVTSAQFEDEATTRIIAALEAEDHRLMGEGIEDYSDDDEANASEFTPERQKERTYSTDSFIKNLQKHGDLQQYRISPMSVTEQHRRSNSEIASQRYNNSMTSAGFLPVVPDHLVSSFFGEDSEEDFVEGVKESLRKSSSIGLDGDKQQQQQQRDDDEKMEKKLSVETRHSVERALSDIKEEEEKEEEEAKEETTKRDPMDATDATKNLTTMGERLKLMQKQGSTLSLRRSSFNNSRRSLMNAVEGSGDQLLNALSNASKRKETKGFWRKIQYEYTNLIAPQLSKSNARISRQIFFVTFPGVALACLLYYIFDNPMAGNTGTSVSWWILFVVRQGMMFEFAFVGEVFWVEIMALRSRLFSNAFGPYVALGIIQSKGWPYMMIFWPVLDFCFLYGSHPFPKHWLFWQLYLDVFTEINPVSGVTDSEIYLRILLSLMFVGVVVSLKRLMLAIYLGRRTVAHFGQELETLMAKMILIGEVAQLAKEVENRNNMFPGSPTAISQDDENVVQFKNMVKMDISSQGSPGARRNSHKSLSPRPKSASPLRGYESSEDEEKTKKIAMQQSTNTNVQLLNLLDEWEEPESMAQANAKATVQDLLMFRQAVTSMNESRPFGRSFGLANTREATIESAEKVFSKLMLGVDEDPNSPLPFSVFSVLALGDDGQLMTSKIKSLIRLFRPERTGELSRLDFIKSIDTVYKELRLLRASIANSGQIDIAFEKVVNAFFYFFVVIIAVTILGIDIWTLFLSVNSLILGASFLFGAAASNFFEGLLLIFVRRPYDIGDKVATSNPSNDTSGTGSSTWFVDRVTLFTTTARFATTNEVATLSNGSIARLRIINANRSPKALISVIIKFGLETPFKRISIFRSAVENFIKARPREWITLAAFRVTRVEADGGYVEYKIIGQHRERWQNIGPILQSKADLSSFCLEVSKKLDMRYQSPPMPVNLSASDDVMAGIFGNSDGPASDAAVDRNPLAPSLSADDLVDVNNLFAVRGST